MLCYPHTKSFKNSISLRILYFSLVRPLVIYASTTWRLIHKGDIYSLDKIQQRFLEDYDLTLDGNPTHRFSHDYTLAAMSYNIPSLSFLLQLQDICKIEKLSLKVPTTFIWKGSHFGKIALKFMLRTLRHIKGPSKINRIFIRKKLKKKILFM